MNQTQKEAFEAILEQIDLSQEPPIEEPQRQYYFIKKCREIVKEKSKELGRPLCAASVTFGCQIVTDSMTVQAA